jgi:hypothetical protein
MNYVTDDPIVEFDVSKCCFIQIINKSGESPLQLLKSCRSEFKISFPC